MCLSINPSLFISSIWYLSQDTLNVEGVSSSVLNRFIYLSNSSNNSSNSLLYIVPLVTNVNWSISICLSIIWVIIYSKVGTARVTSPPHIARLPISVVWSKTVSITSLDISLSFLQPLQQCLQSKLHLLVIISPKFWKHIPLTLI